MTPEPPATVTRTLWLDPSFGASGDMLLGTLVGLGVPLDEIVSSLAGLGVGGWSMSDTTTTRGGLTATRVIVEATAHEHGRHWSGIDTMIAESNLSEAVKAGARATFRRLGEVEAAAHGVPIDQVHFHEVGAVDAIVDIVGVWIALESLGVDSVIVGPVGLGSGTVTGAHGILPLPAPATAALLEGAPVRPLDVEMETCTPTGAALLATVGDWGAIPAGTLVRSARGAGGRDSETHPNVVSGHLVETSTTSTRQTAVVLETNLDDVTPEILGYVVDRALALGADDAWITPIVMKKGRPAHTLSVLTTPAKSGELRAFISAETGTLGIRQIAVEKFPLARNVDTVVLLGHDVRIKVGPHGAKPEHDDLRVLADATRLPLHDLAMQALARWRDSSGS